MTRRFVFIALVALVLLVIQLDSGSLSAQDDRPQPATAVPATLTAAPTMSPTSTETPIPTTTPTELPTEILPSEPTATSTPLPPPTVIPEETGEVIPPTNTATAVPSVTSMPEQTEAVTPLPESTDDVTVEPVPATTTPQSTATPPASVEWGLRYQDDFESGDLRNWELGDGWLLDDQEDNNALQVMNNTSPVALNLDNFYDQIVEVRVQTTNATANLVIRKSVAGAYTVTLDSQGRLMLLRMGVRMQMGQTTPSTPGQWRTLRVVAVSHTIQVFVDEVEVMTYVDTAGLPPGGISFYASPDPDTATEYTMLVDDFTLRVPSDELPDQAPATPTLTPSPTLTLTPAPVMELSPEPPLRLVFTDTFDSGSLSNWTLDEAWTLVPSDTGQALQIVQNPSPATFALDTLLDVAVQIRVLVDTGGVMLTLRESDAGRYAVVLDATGAVTLYRNDEVWKTAAAAPTENPWRTLRLSVIGDTVRVTVDGKLVMALQDPMPLPAGTTTISSVGDASLLVDDFELLREDAPNPTPVPEPVQREEGIVEATSTTTTAYAARVEEYDVIQLDGNWSHTTAILGPLADDVGARIRDGGDQDGTVLGCIVVSVGGSFDSITSVRARMKTDGDNHGGIPPGSRIRADFYVSNTSSDCGSAGWTSVMGSLPPDQKNISEGSYTWKSSGTGYSGTIRYVKIIVTIKVKASWPGYNENKSVWIDAVEVMGNNYQSSFTGILTGQSVDRVAFTANPDGNDAEVFIGEGTTHLQITNNDHVDDNPSLQPNGNLIAYQSYYDSKWNLHTIQDDGLYDTSLAENAFDPDWYPDGEHIVFARGNNLHQINTITLVETQLTNHGGGSAHNPAVSPTGHWVIYELDGSLYVVDANCTGSCTSTPLPTGVSGTHEYPAWSNDGSQLAVSIDDDIYTMTVTYNTDTPPKPTGFTDVTSLDGNSLQVDTHPTWSQFGEYIMFESDRDSDTALYTVDLSGGGSVDKVISGAYAPDLWLSAQADLGLLMVVDEPNPETGSLVTYNLTLTNNGPDDATNIEVEDILPTNLVYVSSVVESGTYDPQSGIWHIGLLSATLGVNQTTLSITARAEVGVGETRTNTALITVSDLEDPVSANNQSSVLITVQVASWTDLDIYGTDVGLQGAMFWVIYFETIADTSHSGSAIDDEKSSFLMGAPYCSEGANPPSDNSAENIIIGDPVNNEDGYWMYIRHCEDHRYMFARVVLNGFLNYRRKQPNPVPPFEYLLQNNSEFAKSFDNSIWSYNICEFNNIASSYEQAFYNEQASEWLYEYLVCMATDPGLDENDQTVSRIRHAYNHTIVPQIRKAIADFYNLETNDHTMGAFSNLDANWGGDSLLVCVGGCELLPSGTPATHYTTDQAWEGIAFTIPAEQISQTHIIDSYNEHISYQIIGPPGYRTSTYSAVVQPVLRLNYDAQGNLLGYIWTSRVYKRTLDMSHYPREGE